MDQVSGSFSLAIRYVKSPRETKAEVFLKDIVYMLTYIWAKMFTLIPKIRAYPCHGHRKKERKNNDSTLIRNLSTYIEFKINLLKGEHFED